MTKFCELALRFAKANNKGIPNTVRTKTLDAPPVKDCKKVMFNSPPKNKSVNKGVTTPKANALPRTAITAKMIACLTLKIPLLMSAPYNGNKPTKKPKTPLPIDQSNQKPQPRSNRR